MSTSASLVVFLKGINVGGHRRFRPSVFARELSHLDVVSLGTAGTFVVRGGAGHARIRHELKQRLPFDADVMICEGREIAELVASDPFKDLRTRPDIIQFAGILLKGRTPSVDVPLTIPSTGDWGVKVIARRGRYLLGVHRRQMKAIGQLQQLDKLFGRRITVRGWSTMVAVARVLAEI